MTEPFFSPIDLSQDLSPNCYNEPAMITGEGKEGFWEGDVPNGNNDHTPDKKDNDCTPVTKDNNALPPVQPGTAGEGLPYAPVDWPNPGDHWSWRVGKRVSAGGVFHDRFLTLPKRLQKPNLPKQFGSKPSVVRYIQSEFPNADVNAFFASFSWKIPAALQSGKKEGASLDVETEGEIQKEGTPRTSQRSRRQKPKEISPPIQKKTKEKPASSQKKRKQKAETEPATRKQKPRQSSRRSVRNVGGAVDLNDEEATGESPTKGATDFEDDQVSIPHIYVSPVNGVIAACELPVAIPEEFDNYLNSLEDLLDQRPSEGLSLLPENVNSPVREDELAEARMKLSALLRMDFPSLVFFEDLNELTDIASKLRKDPRLTAEQLVKLKLIEEIPTFSEVFMENKEVIEQADKFFSSLDFNKAKVASLKNEYSELKEKVGQLQAEVDYNTITIREIDEQIAQLKSRRAELSSIIADKEKEKVDLNYAQRMVANSIPRVVQEIQVANSKKPDWVLKKENALKRETEILARFSPLKGFYL